MLGSVGGEGWLAEGLALLRRFPRLSTTTPAFLPTVLGWKRAVGEPAGRRLCVPPWPATPGTVASRASTYAGGSRASAVRPLPVPPRLPSLQNWELTEGPAVSAPGWAEPSV